MQPMGSKDWADGGKAAFPFLAMHYVVDVRSLTEAAVSSLQTEQVEGRYVPVLSRVLWG